MNLRQQVLTSFMHVFFFVLFCSVSCVNHYYFRSAGLDYGLANQALYQFAHGKWAISTMLIGVGEMPYEAVHLSFYVPLVSPFYYLFGSYTLLIFQNLMFIIAGVGLVKLAVTLDFKKSILPWLLLLYYGSFALYNALAVEYHDNVAGACLLPWLFLSWHQQKYKQVAFWLLLMLMAKENMAIWLLFVVTALGWLYRTRKHIWLKQVLPFTLLCIVWFLAAGMLIMPALNPQGKFEQLVRYSHLGNSLGSILWHILTHPVEMLRLFFFSHIQPDAEEIVKQEFLLAVFVSGGIILILQPAFLWMALPILMQKLWNKELAFWGANFHYQTELVPVIVMGWMYLNVNFLKYNLQKILPVMALLTCITTLYLMQSRHAWFDPKKENVLSINHYINNINTGSWNQKLNEIPPDASVCAVSNLLPHLMQHRYLYHFPNIEKARYLVYPKEDLNAYPLSSEDAFKLLDSLAHSSAWECDSSARNLYVLRRKQTQNQER